MSPRSNLTKQAVVRAAAELIHTEGLEALSLSRLADKLDIRTPSLYNHVNGLPGLIEGAFDLERPHVSRAFK